MVVRTARTALNINVLRNIFFLTFGLLAFVGARSRYTPVNSGYVFALAVGIFSLPFLFHFFKATPRNPLWLSKTPMTAGLGLALLGAAIVANGALDYSAKLAKPRAVVRKYANTSARTSKNAHYLVLQCEFMARTNETLVDQDTYSGTLVGDVIPVEFHQGLFGVAWYRQVQLSKP